MGEGEPVPEEWPMGEREPVPEEWPMGEREPVPEEWPMGEREPVPEAKSIAVEREGTVPHEAASHEAASHEAAAAPKGGPPKATAESRATKAAAKAATAKVRAAKAATAKAATKSRRTQSRGARDNCRGSQSDHYFAEHDALHSDRTPAFGNLTNRFRLCCPHASAARVRHSRAAFRLRNPRFKVEMHALPLQ
jgi:hypothetical protein